MTGLYDLADELLSAAASHLADNSTNIARQNENLLNLALTSRRLRPIAQENLHRHVAVTESIMPSSEEVRLSGPTNAVNLVRTLQNRPDFARMVLRLSVIVWKRPKGHRTACTIPDSQRNCKCGWTKIESTCNTYFEAWVKLFRLILQMVLKLDKLTWISMPINWEVQTSAELEDMFPIVLSNVIRSLEPHDFEADALRGLVNLKSISANVMAPWSIFTLPNLTSLRLKVPRCFSYDLLHKDSANRTIEAIAVEITCYTLQSGVGLSEFRCDSFFHDFLPRLYNLKHMSFELIDTIESGSSFFDRMIFNNLVDFIPIKDLQTLAIDIREHDMYFFWTIRGSTLHEMFSIKSLANFKNLKRLVVPQEVLFSFEPYVSICKLPTSIESVEFIDSTTVISLWASRIYEMKDMFPNLKQIVGWKGRYRAHRVPDNRVGRRIRYFPNSNRNFFELQSLESMFPNVNWDYLDSIWHDLEDLGIKIIWKENTDTDWRFV